MAESLVSGLCRDDDAPIERVAARYRTDEQTAEWHRCAGDLRYWLNAYAWTYNPKLPPGRRWIRFELFPRQEDLIAWLRECQDLAEEGLIEKSRDVGVSWVCIGYAVHLWLFSPEFKAAFGSRKEDLVDRKGDPDSLFEKARLLIRRLPEWMLPGSWDERKYAGHLKLINPENGSVITGEAGDNIGRGGRNTIYFLDEAAFMENADSVEAALSNNCDVVIWVSTVNGVGNAFYKKRHGGACRVFVFDWREDPRKTDAWYAAQVAKFAHNPSIVASEIDRDYTASVEGVVIPGKWVKAAVGAHERLGWAPSNDCQAAADVAAGGANLTVFGSRRGPVVSGLASSTESNTTLVAYWLRDRTREVRASMLHYDAIGVGIGCKSTFDLEENLGFRTDAILGGEAPTEDEWPDGRTSKEMFLNRRAELYWKLRERFRKTHEVVEGVAEHPVEECISIPNHADLIAQLSVPLEKHTATGKKRIESKLEMRDRGVMSPDWADMLVYLFAPMPAAPAAPIHIPREELTARDYSVFGFIDGETTSSEAF